MIAAPALALVGFAGLLSLLRRRADLVCLLLMFIIGTVWRLISVAYIDMAGPLPSIELFRFIGGGAATVPLTVCYALLFLPFFIVFRRSKRAELSAITVGGDLDLASSLALHTVVSKWVFRGYALFLLLLWADMLRGGVIPLFAGIERYVFTNEMSGPFHRMLVKYGMHVSFVLGCFNAFAALRSDRPDRRFLALLLVTFFYLFVAGNRFSAFYSHTCFFLIPWTAVVIRRQFAPPSPVERQAITSRARRVGLVVMVVAVLGGMIGYAMYRSLVFARSLVGSDAVENVGHRVLVLQGGMWTATYERVFENGVVDPAGTYRRLFVQPIWDPGRNSTVPHLMELEIGDKVWPILEIGSTYSGGYPEILFELLGSPGGFIAVFLAALVMASMLRAVLRALIEQRYVRVVLLFWLTYLTMLFHFGGMMNSFSSWKFPVKVGIVVFWLVYESGRRRLRPLFAPPADIQTA